MEETTITSDFSIQLDIEDTEKILIDFIKNNDIVHVQRSAEWHELRRMSFGGSEIAAIIGSDPYSNFKNVVASKLGILKFDGNMATLWGQIFEDVSKKILSSKIKCQIYEMNCIRGIIDHNHYSPDGLAVINGKIVLLEFKSPFTRLPDGSTMHYKYQVMSGLMNMDIVDKGLLVDAKFCKCSMKDWNYTNSYDTAFHKEFKAPVPEYIGLIYFKLNKKLPTGFGKKFKTLIYGDTPQLLIRSAVESRIQIDFGSCDKQVIEYLFLQVAENKILMSIEFNLCDDKNYLGVLPWKCFIFNMIEITRDAAIIEHIKKKLELSSLIFNKILQQPLPKEYFSKIFTGCTTISQIQRQIQIH